MTACGITYLYTAIFFRTFGSKPTTMRLAVVCTISCLLIGCMLSAQESQPAEYREVEALLASSVDAGSDSAFAILQRALDLSRSSGYRMGEAKALTYTGIEKEEIADHEGAIPLYLASLDVYAAIADSLGIGKCYLNLGAAFSRLNNTPKATEYWEKALPLLMRHGQPAHQIVLLNNLTGAYNVTEPKRALVLSEQALKIAFELNDTARIADALNNKGTVLLKLKRLAEAETCFRQCLQLYSSYGDADNYCRSLANLGETLNMMGRYRQSQQLLQSDTALCLLMSPDIQTLFFNQLGNSALGLGDYQTAYNYLLKLKTIDDSLFTVERNEIAAELDAKYQTQLKNNQIKLLEQEKTIQDNLLRNQRLALWSVIVGLLLLGGMAWVVWRGKRHSDDLLANILPEETIQELKEKGRVQARRFEMASVLFSDFKGFTKISEILSPEDLVAEIDHCFRAFDDIIAKYRVEKIKTIGDSYMCASGLPNSDPRHAHELVSAALEMQRFMDEYNAKRQQKGLLPFPMRVGIHSGPVVAGVVGARKFAYDIWGDTVNTASRLESRGKPGKVNISESTYALVKDAFACEPRGNVAIKNKADIAMYFVLGRLS